MTWCLYNLQASQNQMQLLGLGSYDPGPVAFCIAKLQSRFPKASNVRGDGGRWEREVGASKSWVLFTARSDGSYCCLIQSDGHFSGEGAEPPNFRQDPSAGAAEKPRVGVADLLWPGECEWGRGLITTLNCTHRPSLTRHTSDSNQNRQ